ncbi:hypothetical protein CEXT_96461 [Caerostris extrusa]|uniref:Uncharacterized protein n=1 Tax=Caerostris extrusa TaxID=172846 RepID=A0AAV4T5P6_CAEEX|nr:hypothetical protein CEXT_96461 [Caerostris extrusa]
MIDNNTYSKHSQHNILAIDQRAQSRPNGPQLNVLSLSTSIIDSSISINNLNVDIILLMVLMMKCSRPPLKSPDNHTLKQVPQCTIAMAPLTSLIRKYSCVTCVLLLRLMCSCVCIRSTLLWYAASWHVYHSAIQPEN